MSRPRAAGLTGAILAGCAAAGYAIARWPNASLIGLSAAAIYLKLRDPAPEPGGTDAG